MTYQMVLNIMSTNPLVYYLETDFWLQKYIISCRFCKLPPQPVRERPFWGVSHRVEPLSRLHLSPSKGIYFFILKFCFMLNNSS